MPKQHAPITTQEDPAGDAGGVAQLIPLQVQVTVESKLDDRFISRCHSQHANSDLKHRGGEGRRRQDFLGLEDEQGAGVGEHDVNSSARELLSFSGDDLFFVAAQTLIGKVSETLLRSLAPILALALILGISGCVKPTPPAFEVRNEFDAMIDKPYGLRPPDGSQASAEKELSGPTSELLATRFPTGTHTSRIVDFFQDINGRCRREEREGAILFCDYCREKVDVFNSYFSTFFVVNEFFWRVEARLHDGDEGATEADRRISSLSFLIVNLGSAERQAFDPESIDNTCTNAHRVLTGAFQPRTEVRRFKVF